jgi:hypothetical protein
MAGLGAHVTGVEHAALAKGPRVTPYPVDESQ